MANTARTIELTANTADLNSQDPYWICATLPYKFADTFDRRRLAKYATGELDVSLQDALGTPAQSDEMLVFGDDDITTWSVTASKSSFTSSFQAQLVNNGVTNYLQQVMPGDYLFFWSFEDRESYERVLGSLCAQFNVTPKRGKDAAGPEYALNAWDSGLKFMGTVESVRQFESIAQGGRIQVGYSLSAYGGTEFGNHVYYDAQVKFNYRNAVQFMGTLGLSAEQFLTKSGFVNTSVSIPFLAYLYLGRGPTEVNVDPSGIAIRGNPGIKDTPNRALEIPDAVSRLMGVNGSGYKGVFSDLIQFFVGVQVYNKPAGNDPWTKVLPDLKAAQADFTGTYSTGPELDDHFSPQPLDFKNTTVWALMNSYLNPPMNEMYVAWKPNQEGRLYPTVTVRRLPLVSDDYINSSDQGAYPTTPFSKLPRWVVNPRIVKSADFGRSNTSRVNAVYVNGSSKISPDSTTNDLYNRATAPPAFNGADIYRCGLRTFFVTVPAFTESQFKNNDSNPGRFFTAMMADVLMDQHLRFSGSIHMIGRQDPVVPGDNLVYNGILFHIEQVQHNGGIAIDGKKTFDTTVWVSNGLPLAVLDPRSNEQESEDSQPEIDSLIKGYDDVSAEAYNFLQEEILKQASVADLDGFRLLTKRNDRQDLNETSSSLAGTVGFTRNE